MLSCSVHVIIVGDLNVDLLKSSSAQAEYVNLFADFQFTQHITQPTRVTNLSATLIDHVLTSPPLNVIKYYQAVGLSDHRSQIAEIDIAVVKTVPREIAVCSFCKCPWDKVKEALQTAPWQVMEIYDDMWVFFISILHKYLNTYAPLHTTASKRSNCHTPWITPFLLSAIKQKRQAKRKADSTTMAPDIVEEPT